MLVSFNPNQMDMFRRGEEIDRLNEKYPGLIGLPEEY